MDMADFERHLIFASVPIYTVFKKVKLDLYLVKKLLSSSYHIPTKVELPRSAYWNGSLN